MNRLNQRVSALEAQHGGPKKTLYVWMPPGLTENEQAAFIAAEKRRHVGDDETVTEIVAFSWLPHRGVRWRRTRP